MKASFILYHDSRVIVDMLTDERAGKLLKTIFQYTADGTIPELDEVTAIAFASIRAYLDRDAAKYAETCEKRKTSGMKGGIASSKSKQMLPNGSKSKQKQADNDNDNENDNDIEKEKVKKEKARFAPPTVEQVREYVKENGYSVDADRFVDFYQSKNWHVGKDKMTDWKAAVRGWSHRQRQDETAKGQRQAISAKGKNRFVNADQRAYDFDDLEKKLRGIT